MRKLILALAIAFAAPAVNAADQYEPQLNQLASEIAGYLVGTPDGTFQSVTYKNGQLVMRLNENSRLNQQFYATDDYDKKDELLDTLLLHIFHGDSGVQIMTFLEQTRTAILLEMPLPGDSSQCSEKSFWPGDLKTKLQKK